MASDRIGREGAAATKERRDAARRRVVWLAKLETARGGCDCRVSNISPGGARVRVPETIGLGQAVTLVTSGHGEFYGVIAWERDGIAGIKFTDRDLSDGANRIASANKHFSGGERPADAVESPAPAPVDPAPEVTPEIALDERPAVPTSPARLTVVETPTSPLVRDMAAKAAANPLLADLAGLLGKLRPTTPAAASAPPPFANAAILPRPEASASSQSRVATQMRSEGMYGGQTLTGPALAGPALASPSIAPPTHSAPTLASPALDIFGGGGGGGGAPGLVASAAPGRVVPLAKPARYSPPPGTTVPRLVAEEPTTAAGHEPMGFVADDRISTAVAVLHPAINELIDPKVAVRMPRVDLRLQLADLLREIARKKNVLLSRAEQTAVVERILDEMLGLGPLEPLLADDSVTDILVNGAKQVFVERKGKLELTDVTFMDDQHVMNIALRIVTKVGRRLDESTPLVDARLPDGSRVNVIVPPLALHGPMISIRKFAKKKITVDLMVRQTNLSAAMATILKIAARSRLNILISGGTGSGKTTLLNAISQNIDPAERIITIEDAAELQLQLPHVGSLETRPPSIEGKGEVTMRDLFKNALRMRPDRIILGEIRSAEAYDVLQAMNTGHDGSLATIHASGPREALSRIENIIAVSGIDIPTAALKQQISAALDMIVQVSRMRDGKRRITHITEIVGQEGAVYMMQDLFTYQYTSESANGELNGRYVSSGLRPYCMPKAEHYGLHRVLLEAMSSPDVPG
jgi:pilus assembly protein CpaF